jgi:hypothetical protein
LIKEKGESAMSDATVVDVLAWGASGGPHVCLQALALAGDIRRLHVLARKHKYPNTLLAANLATQLHAGQRRKSGEPYITHPVNVARLLIIDGVRDDVVLASALLHDVLEDCRDASPDNLLTLGIHPEVISTVQVLTKQPGQDARQYYAQVGRCPQATLVKLADRCHNLATMAGVFTVDKIREYVSETEKYVLPLCHNDRSGTSMHAGVMRLLEDRIRTILADVRTGSGRTLAIMDSPQRSITGSISAGQSSVRI